MGRKHRERERNVFAIPQFDTHGEDIENKNIKVRPILMSDRYGVLLFASPVLVVVPLSIFIITVCFRI